MNTEIVSMSELNIDKPAIEQAGNIIRQGGLVAFPTETVYGLGGDALNPDSSRKIYAAKGRPSDNPLIVHISQWEDIEKIVKDVPKAAEKLAEVFWPGPLTMIFNKSDIVPFETTGGLDTVAVRMPSNKIARRFIEAAGGYIAAPSANISGRPSPTVAQYVIEDMQGRIEMIIDGGASDVGLESTIVDVTGPSVMILRPGYITQEMLEDVLQEEVLWDRAIIDSNSKTPPKAPGMKYRHYAPKGELVVVEGDSKRVIEEINRLVAIGQNEGKKTGVIATDETKDRYVADSVKSAGRREHEEDAAHLLFKILREFDDEGMELMYSESFEGTGIGRAIMNRLLKAAGHKVIKV